MAEAPDLEPHLIFYFKAYSDLSSCRAGGLVPWTAVYEYAKFYNLDQEQLEELVYFVREMDVTFSDWEKSKQPKAPPAQKLSRGGRFGKPQRFCR